MKIVKFKYGFFILMMNFILNTNVISQDIQVSQNYASPLYLNPAFAGFNVCARASTLIRNQWPGLPKGYISEMMSFDHFLVNQNIGLGLLFTNDVAGSGRLRSTSFNGIFAYESQVNRNFGMRFGFQAGFGTRSINFNDLIFGDQLSRGGDVPTVETPTINRAFSIFLPEPYFTALHFGEVFRFII